MSENEIKPVLTIDANTLEMAKVETRRAERVATRPYSKLRVEMGEVALYDQYAIDRLKAERDAAVADAERYRWLRQDAGFDGWTMPKSPTPCPDNIDGCKVQHHGRELSGSALDTAIDAARAEVK